MATDFHKPQGRRTIRRAPVLGPGNPMVPQGGGRENRQIHMCDLGDPKPGTTAHKLHQAYHAALGAVDRTEARKADTLKSGKFTEAGAKDDVTQFTLSELTPVFRQGRKVVDAAKRQAKELRDKIKLQPPDKTDIVGALRRREMREFLKAMPDKDRNRYVAGQRENMDPDLALAIVEMPAVFSGVLPRA
jgi:hypothetical protein